MGNVEEPARWQRDQDPWGHWHRGPFGHRRHGPFWLRHRGTGEPLRREPGDRLAGGVAAGMAAWKGFSVNTVRIGFVLLTTSPALSAVTHSVVEGQAIPDSSGGSAP